MPSSFSTGSRINTNIPAENAYNSLNKVSKDIAQSQLRLSTGKRINTAADDVSGYITSRALQSRNKAINSALTLVGEARNVTTISQDALENISGLLSEIKENTVVSSSGSLGTDEKVALAKASYRMAQQIEFVVDSTVFGSQQLLHGSFAGSWFVGFNAKNSALTIDVNLKYDNEDFNIQNGNNSFHLNPPNDRVGFAGVHYLALDSFDEVNSEDLGVFSDARVGTTLTSISNALHNVNKVAAYLGGIQVRLDSQEELLKSQITNYNAAISRIEDADVATEQLNLAKNQFLQATSLSSLSQANQNPQAYLTLFF